MLVRINRKAILQYCLIYFLIIINQSCLYEYFMRSNSIRYTICFILFIFFLKKYKYQYNKYLIYFILLLISVVITRIINGGIGIGAWVGYVIPILACILAININKKKFLERFVKLSTFLATIGLIFFFLQVVKPEILKSILLTKYMTLMDYKVWSDSYNYKTMYYPGYGLFLYSFRDGGDALLRNKGLFTESGICQMLYNAAIFILLFLNHKINISNKQVSRYLFILIVAVFTVQSSTGILILSVMLLVDLFFNNKNKHRVHNLKKKVIFIICMGIILLLLDFFKRGNESVIYIGLIQKFLGSNNEYQLHGNGQVRLGAAVLSLKIMSENIFGIGVDKLMELQRLYDVDGGGAGIFTFGASIGLIPFLFTLFFYVYPIIKNRESITTNFILLFFIFFSLLAQSNPFYPLLVMFPIYYYESKS